jgi:hypothetical protein
MRSLRPILSSLIALSALVVQRRALADRSPRQPEVGYNYGEIETPRATAMGGAMRALGNGTTALYTNPADLALTRVYHLEALAAIWPEARRQTYGATIVDSVTGRLAGGIGGHYGVQDPDGLQRKWTDLRLGLAFPFSDKLFAGLGGHYLKLRQDGLVPPFGASAASSGLSGVAIVDGFSFDAGLTLKPSDSLSIGVVGVNLTNPGNGFMPTSFGGGIGYGNDDLTIEGDVLADFTTYTGADGTSRTTARAMAGIEYLAADHYPLRAGYRFDQGAHTHAISGGLGYVDRQFSVEVSVRRSVSGPDAASPATAVVIGLQYFIESTGLTRSPGDAAE